ncbi:hypothetical protein ACJMK2_041902 [Sinanodonta woodiana]|uniref:Uncharacterized protein n=1 Tax=Sinanodonta woodiana TaxID=1069815 RepID=A0ABD3W6B8_SINWO
MAPSDHDSAMVKYVKATIDFLHMATALTPRLKCHLFLTNSNRFEVFNCWALAVSTFYGYNQPKKVKQTCQQNSAADVPLLPALPMLSAEDISITSSHQMKRSNMDEDASDSSTLAKFDSVYVLPTSADACITLRDACSSSPKISNACVASRFGDVYVVKVEKILRLFLKMQLKKLRATRINNLFLLPITQNNGGKIISVSFLCYPFMQEICSA